MPCRFPGPCPRGSLGGSGWGVSRPTPKGEVEEIWSRPTAKGEVEGDRGVPALGGLLGGCLVQGLSAPGGVPALGGGDSL